MAGYTQAYQQTTLDANHPTSGNGDHLAYSSNGSSENTTIITARTPIGATGWAAATAATPSVKANNAVVTTPAAAAAGTITHTAIFSALSGGTQKTDWTAMAASKTLAISDVIQFPIGAIAITLD